MRTCSKREKKEKKKKEAPYSSSGPIHIAENPKIPNWFDLSPYLHLFLKAEVFTWAAKLKTLAHTPPEVVAHAWRGCK